MADYKTNGYEYKPQTIDYNNTAANTTPRATQKKQGGKMKENFRRFWWLHLLNFVVGTLLISLLLTYVGLPKIAQSDVNKAEMVIDSQTITNPTPDQINLHVENTVNSKSLFRPTLDAFEASLFLEDTEPDIKPFGKINIPSVHATKVSHASVDQVMKILDQEQFRRYNELVSKSNEFRLAVRGRTRLHLGALPVVTVDFNKAVKMKGLNGLQGIRVEDIKISILPNPDGSNMNGTIVIPNPSVMTLTLGDMVQNISSNGQLIGQTKISNVVLKPGDNRFFMSSTADQATVITQLTTDPAKSGILHVEATTISVTYNGQRLPYFEAALAATPVKLDLNLKDALKDAGLDLFPTGGTGGGLGDTSPTSSSSVAAPLPTSGTPAPEAPTPAPTVPAA